MLVLQTDCIVHMYDWNTCYTTLLYSLINDNRESNDVSGVKGHDCTRLAPDEAGWVGPGNRTCHYGTESSYRHTGALSAGLSSQSGGH